MSRLEAFRNVLLIGAASVALGACGADDVASPGEGVVVIPSPTPTPTPTPTPGVTPGQAAPSCPTGTADVGTIGIGGGTTDTRRVCQISGTIRGSLRLQNLVGTIYALSGKVQVGDDQGADANNPAAGAQSGILTLDAGVTLFGASGADFLLVNRGSQLIVDGNASKPVVMTSRNNVVGDVNADSIGQWGGLVILGRAPIGDCADAGATGGTIQCQAPVEGTSGSIYGGASPNESSGRIQYLQVRYPGFRVDTNNELNGITLGGVGSGTIFDHVQVHNSSDDGIEWFGGRVNQKYLVLTGNDDDSLDADSGYKGASQFVIVDQRAGGGDKVAEIGSSDKPNDAIPRTDFLLSNWTFVARSSVSGSQNIHIRGGDDVAMYNGTMSGARCLDIDDAATVQTAGTDEKGAPRFASVYLTCTTAFVEDTNVTATQIAAIFNAGPNNTSNGTSTLTGFINGANENGVVATNPTTLSSFFTSVNYIGAVRDAADTWWRGWTCGTASTEMSCLSIPAAG